MSAETQPTTKVIASGHSTSLGPWHGTDDMDVSNSALRPTTCCPVHQLTCDRARLFVIYLGTESDSRREYWTVANFSTPF
jgi:hypothetical protein